MLAFQRWVTLSRRKRARDERTRNRKYAPHTRDRCSFREWFLILVYVGTRARVYCRAGIEQARAFLLLFFVLHTTVLPSHEKEPDRVYCGSLGVCGTLLCGRSLFCATRRWLSQYMVSRTLNRNFGRIFRSLERVCLRLSC